MPSSDHRRFTVKRHEPELVPPAELTPRVSKPLSNIDDQESLRFLVDMCLIFPGNHNNPKDPARVLREALAKTLVFYYPLAGWLREGPGRKLVVDCTGEGLMFVEAEADVTLEYMAQEGGFLSPPLPCYEELLFNVPGFGGILDSPLLLIQVTHFTCGGFMTAVRFNHTIADAAGFVQFLGTVAEMAHGASQPSVLPVWRREVLCSGDPPRVTCSHWEYEGVDGPILPFYNDDKVVEGSFFFGPSEFSALRRLLPANLKRCTTYELLSAFLWRCRTAALQFNPSDEVSDRPSLYSAFTRVRYLTLVNARSRFNPPLLEGYYGNTFCIPAAICTAEELSTSGLDHAVELIKKAKAQVTEEYIRSVADYMAVRGRPHFKVANTWIISDNKSFKYLDVDLGFGKPIYGGPSSAVVGAASGPISFFVKARNAVGESGVLLLICLPEAAMERVVEEVKRYLVN